MKPALRLLSAFGLLLAATLVLLYLAGGGGFGTLVRGGEIETRALPAEVVHDRDARQVATASHVGSDSSKQILFGDLHVHSSFSTDAFQLTLPMMGGEGVHPVGDACDFARYCAGLDFWSINDHAASITARRWADTVRAVRQCNEVSESGDVPDLVSFLGWEWTQMGSMPENHYGHKNVVLRDLEDGSIPTRPIAAAPPPGVPSSFDAGTGGRFMLGLATLAIEGGHDLVRSLNEISKMERCPSGVPVRDLPLDCSEAVETPAELFTKLDEWGHAATVIPHGTTWGMYTPAGSSWAKQLDPAQHDSDRQRVVEVYSGHGNAEEYRSWRAVEIDAAGRRRCPEPDDSHTPACWRAGEIIRARCLADSDGRDETADEIGRVCDAAAAGARQNFVDADRNAGPWTVPGLLPYELLDSGQCRDCFQPAFNFRPLGSVQYMLALGRPEQPEDTRRFRFGFIGSSDNHTARPGTGYKEVSRRHFTDARLGEVGRTDLVLQHRRPSAPRSERFPNDESVPSVAFLEAERGGSFFLTGGLAAVHANGRDRGEIWNALERRETYATSGPRILLWFDWMDPNAPDGVRPMGSLVETSHTPTFRVRAAGSFEQNPGCPKFTTDVLEPDRIESLCRGECYFPSERRRPIDRIEVVRIRPQKHEDESVEPLIEDPWMTLPCSGDPAGCQAEFSDPDFSKDRRDTTYYVRAIEVASPTIAADPLGCAGDPDESNETGCAQIAACLDQPDEDDCLAPSEQRAWSSPIFVDYASPLARNE